MLYPYIPFKTDSQPAKDGSKPAADWNRAYYEFLLNREAFERHYHLRSNVEAAIQMVKAKCGSYVRSRNPLAQVNEVMAKLVAHNICVLIHAMFELGIMPDFSNRLVLPQAA